MWADQNQMLGTQQLRAQLAVGECVWQSVLPVNRLEEPVGPDVRLARHWPRTPIASYIHWCHHLVWNLLHRNFKLGFEVEFCVWYTGTYCQYTHTCIIIGVLANGNHPYVLHFWMQYGDSTQHQWPKISTGILCRRNPLCFRVDHAAMEQILPLLRFCLSDSNFIPPFSNHIKGLVVVWLVCVGWCWSVV